MFFLRRKPSFVERRYMYCIRNKIAMCGLDATLLDSNARPLRCHVRCMQVLLLELKDTVASFLRFLFPLLPKLACSLYCTEYLPSLMKVECKIEYCLLCATSPTPDSRLKSNPAGEAVSIAPEATFSISATRQTSFIFYFVGALVF